MVFRDKVLAGTIAGMVASLFKDLPNFILYKLNIVHYLYLHFAASAQLFPGDIDSNIGYIIGFLADIITGGAVGFTLILFLSYFGYDYWWYKGLIAGNALWLFGLGVILNLGAVHLIPNDPVFRFTSLFDHQIFGLVASYLITKWYPFQHDISKT